MHITNHSIGTLLSLLLLSPLITANPISPNPLHKRTLLTMGRCAAFGAVAATSLSNTLATVVTGECGTCPGTSITGFNPPGTCTSYSPDGTAACNAEADCLTAYNDGVALPCTTLASSNLGGQTLAPGVYCFPTPGVTLSGTLTLNGATNPNGQWVFRIGTTFTTSANAVVKIENGAQACNAYFLIGSSATIAANNILLGNYIAYTAITVAAGTSNQGTLAALNAAITLSDDSLTALKSCTL